MSGTTLGPKVECPLCELITQARSGAHKKCREQFFKDFGYDYDDGLEDGYWVPGRHGVLEWVQVGVA